MESKGSLDFTPREMSFSIYIVIIPLSIWAKECECHLWAQTANQVETTLEARPGKWVHSNLSAQACVAYSTSHEGNRKISLI